MRLARITCLLNADLFAYAENVCYCKSGKRRIID